MNYEQDISINLHNLDEEWIKQAATFHFYLVQLANAQRDREEIRSEQEELVADRYDEIRLDLAGAGAATKVTETSIKRVIEADPGYRNIDDRMKGADHTINLLNAAVKAMDQKKTALENLTKLQLSDWYSRPRDEKEQEEGRKEHLKTLNETMPRPKAKETRPARV